GAGTQVVGGAQERLLLGAQVGRLRHLARLDDRRQLADATREVEVVDVRPRPVEGGADRLEAGRQVLFLLRRRRARGRRQRQEQQREDDEGQPARAHRNLTTWPLLRPTR